MLNGPLMWLGQSVDTSSICSNYDSLKSAPFLTSLGCAIRRPSLKESHFNKALRLKLGVDGPIMVDSGGFVLSKTPESNWDVRDVAGLIGKIDADIFVSLDHPPHVSDSAARRKRKIVKSAKNYEILVRAFPSKIIMPVVHGRTLAEVTLSIKMLRDSHNPTWIGLGGIVPLLLGRFASMEISSIGSEKFLALAIGMIRTAFPSGRIHVFGAGGTRTFPVLFGLGGDSADSIGWRQAAGFGSVFLPLKSQRVVTWNRDCRAPRKTLDKSDRVQLGRCNCPICVKHPLIRARVAALRTSFHNRSIHNAWTLIHQRVAWPRDRTGMVSLIREGTFGPKWAEAINCSASIS
jgi:queuine/archaeosine tRNA-ribosyltransferase